MFIRLHLRLIILSLFISSSIFLISCKDEDPEPGLPDLRVYLDRFEEEAALRGYDFDLSDMEIEYVDEILLGDERYCGVGYSNYDESGKRRIEISTSGRCAWATRSDIQRENLFFHEMGHAFFNRSHLRGKLCDGMAISMMSNEVNGWEYYASEETDKRSYYISELLDRSIEGQCIDYSTISDNDTAYYQYDSEDYWFFINRNEDFIGMREGDVLSIELEPDSISTETGNWLTTLYPNFEDCANVSFKATLNSDGLIGKGASISLRAFERDQMTKFGAPESYHETLYLTTEDNPATGKLIDHKEEIKIECLSRDTWFIVLFVRLLPETEGKVTFSDIRLIVNE